MIAERSTRATPSLADSLELVLEALPEVLVPAEARDYALALAEELPPVHRCGFEVRLGDAAEVDFQQGITTRMGERTALIRHAQTVDRFRARIGHLAQFLNAWGELSGHLSEDVGTVWLEFDRPPAASLSVFVGFRPGRLKGPAGLALAENVVRALGGSALGPSTGAIRRCLEACPNGTWVSYLGLMIGRPAPGARINVGGLKPERISAFLVDAGFEWPTEPVVELGELLSPLCGGLTLCLDVAGTVGPNIGFECQPPSQPRQDSGWCGLELLVERGWCTPAKRDALLSWPQVHVPAEDSRWPADLACATLRRPADHLTSIHRLLNHVKVVRRPESTEAKGYFGYAHEWLRPPAGTEEAPGQRDSRPLSTSSASTGLAAGIDAARDFLLASATEAGLWRDFPGRQDGADDWSRAFSWSDEWVSAAVGVVLAATAHPDAVAAARRAWELLVARRLPEAGWGYSRWAPVDGDSTAWVLRLAHAVGEADHTWASAGFRMLERHRAPDGGIVTYLSHLCPRSSTRSLLPPDGSYAGWCKVSHACVTVSAALLGDEPARDCLRRTQQPDGRWLSYWWPDDEYATAMAAEALTGTGRTDDRARLTAAADWARSQIDQDGSVRGSEFATSLVLRTLEAASGQARADRDRLCRWLLANQQSDGGWISSARMLAPRPDVLARDDSPIAPLGCPDDQRLFTTAFVLHALLGAER